MKLAQALRLKPSPPFGSIALVGSGGKTTALFQLARGLPAPVIVSASTHLHVNQIKLADSHWIAKKPADLAALEEAPDGVMLVTGPVEGERTTGLDDATLHWLDGVCRRRGLPLLIEADGSRQRPLKAPEEYEPPIPDFVETVVVVAGLSGLGKPLGAESVHRPEIFARLSGLTPNETITPEALRRVLGHPAGGLKNIPAQARRVLLLNQADTPELQATGGKLAQALLADYEAVLVGTLEPARLQPFERIAGIVLAAGESKRFGQPKQVLHYRGQPFVRTVAETALASGLAPVVVVSGANSQAVEAALQGLPVTIAHNTDWQSGQSSSIRAGLRALSPDPLPASPKSDGFRGGSKEVGAAVFLLADQPQVTATVVRALVEQHSLELAPILAPLVSDRRANPVLFDRVTFPDLMALTGDVGGRAVFSKYPVTYLPWQDESLLLDVDTPADLEKLREQSC
ncbi:MAG: selenium cofactor biosynthesis protein YqeC [Anaerolineales bacterium]